MKNVTLTEDIPREHKKIKLKKFDLKTVIKTFLPDTIANFLDYVQQFIDKENANKVALAA